MKRQQLDREGAEQAWVKCMDLQQQAAGLAPEVASLHNQLVAQYRWRAECRRDFGDLDSALEDLKHVRERYSDDAGNLFLTAATRASFVLWIDQQEEEGAQEALREHRETAMDEAVVWLNEAVAAGFTEVDQIEQQPEFAVVRERDDFKSIMLKLRNANAVKE